MKTLFVNPCTNSNDLLIEQCPSNKTHCKACSAAIDKYDLRVSFHRAYSKGHYFHLHCFHPITQVRIRSCDVEMRIEDQQRTAQVVTWLQDWNSQFHTNADIARYARKSVCTQASPFRRTLLEVFKYLEVREIALVATQVAKTWYHAAWEDEVWGNTGLLHGQVRSRQDYITAFYGSCVHCGKSLSSEQVFMVCPRTKRPKCEQCYSHRENRPQRLKWLKTQFCVSPAFLKLLKLPTFTFDNEECTYISLINDAIARHRAVLGAAIVASKSIVISASVRTFLEQATLEDFGLFELSYRKTTFMFDQKLYHVLSSGQSLEKAEKILASGARKET